MSAINRYSEMSTLDFSLFPDGPTGVYRMGHSILAREGVLFLDPAFPPGESQRQVPSTLLPSPLCRPHYESVLAMQPLLNTLYRRVSRDPQFLRDTLQTILSDRFTEQLWEILEETQPARSRRPTVGILRSDYMLHCRGADCGMKQVEVNTICVSLAAVSQRVERAHKYISAVFKKTPAPPLNEAGDRLAELLALARLEYIRTVPDAKSPVVLFVRADTDHSFYDHYYVLAKLQSDLHVPTASRSLDELDRDARVDGGRVFVGEFEVRTASVSSQLILLSVRSPSATTDRGTSRRTTRREDGGCAASWRGARRYRYQTLHCNCVGPKECSRD